jgi:TIR domain
MGALKVYEPNNVLLNAKLAEIAEEMQLKLAEDKAAAHAEGLQRCNIGFYPAERVLREVRRADEWAEKLFHASLQVWETQGKELSPAFYRATYKDLLAPLFGSRKESVVADMMLEDQRTRRPGHSDAAIGELSRAMSRLSSRWKRNIEIASQENDSAMQRKRKHAAVVEPLRLAPVNKWDVFISHASEDKDQIARPLAEALRSEGYHVWYDEFTLTVGDSLRKSIDQGLTRSSFGVVILSEYFFGKHWPEQELNGLASNEVNGKKVILPVWHNVGFERVRSFSPVLADRLAVDSAKGVQFIVEQLKLAMS